MTLFDRFCILHQASGAFIFQYIVFWYTLYHAGLILDLKQKWRTSMVHRETEVCHAPKLFNT